MQPCIWILSENLVKRKSNFNLKTKTYIRQTSNWVSIFYSHNSILCLQLHSQASTQNSGSTSRVFLPAKSCFTMDFKGKLWFLCDKFHHIHLYFYFYFRETGFTIQIKVTHIIIMPFFIFTDLCAAGGCVDSETKKMGKCDLFKNLVDLSCINNVFQNLINSIC